MAMAHDLTVPSIGLGRTLDHPKPELVKASIAAMLTTTHEATVKEKQ
jgi:hypothetical protein